MTTANLQPHESVLEVGCGCGRMAAPLTQYLSQRGSYDGFDVMPDAIEWCKRNITSRYPNFRFRHADVQNETYNRNGSSQAAIFSFPYPDSSFDFAFLISVFTHMLPTGVERYMQEIYRVLKPGGRCLMSYFLLNPESETASSSGRTLFQFKQSPGQPFAAVFESQPEDALAYPETVVRGMLKQHHLEISKPIYYGSWTGRNGGLSLQDIVIAHRRGAS